MVTIVENSDKLFEELEKELTTKLSVVSFIDYTAAPTNLNEFYEEVTKSFSLKVILANSNEANLGAALSYFQVVKVPVSLFIIGMSVIKAIEGFEVPLLYESIQHYTQNFSTELERVRNAYNEQLHRIINEKALAVFIKGTPEAPKTRRTHQMVRILNGYDYSYFNVTTDKALTEWLKLYTNSPMLPQFFIKGNYSGTLEELIELSKSGTLFTELSQDLNTRLQKIINSHKLLVVVKGSKEQPLCGFSRKMMQLLDEYQLDYETFDILLDYQVREGLKKLSNWPTYPQVYANGELVGGLDICMELHSQGSLIDAINPS